MFPGVSVILISVVLIFISISQNKENGAPTFEDQLIASTFKTLAKTFTMAIDLDSMKQKNMVKLTLMDDEKFKKKYRKIYPFIKDLTEDIRKQYGIEENMSKNQAIKNLSTLDKKSVYKLIDSVPTTVIVNIFKKNKSLANKDWKKNDTIGEIKLLWNKSMVKIE